MAKLKLTKIDVAERQLRTAIELRFSGKDPVSIHTLAMAAFRVLKDVSEHQAGNSTVDILIRDYIRPEHEKVFWAAISKASNFFKHADRDFDQEFEDFEE